MTESLPPPVHPIAFDPVPVALRRNGWTAARQRAFIDALATCGSVKTAAAHVGMTARSAHRLRDRPDATSFCDAWEQAVDAVIERIDLAALDRGVNGIRQPVFYGGRQVGSYLRFDDRLPLAVLLARKRPQRRCVTCDALVSSLIGPGSTEFLREIERL